MRPMSFRLYFLALFCAATSALAQQAGSPFQSQTSTYPFSATASAGTAKQIAATTGVTTFQNYLISNNGANGVWVTLASSAALAVQVIPTGSTLGNSVWIGAGTACTLTGPSQAWFNAQTASSTSTLTITGGTGSISCVSQLTGGTGGPTTNVNIAEVGGTAVTSPLPVTTTPATGVAPAALVQCPQAKVAVTGTAVQLGSVALPSGTLILTAGSNNAASIYIGPSTVSNSTGFATIGQELPPGVATAVYVSNTSAVWINGSAGDGVTCSGS